MITITSTRIKKAFLHPGAALNYVKNYLKGEVIRINSKKGLPKKLLENLDFNTWPIEDLISSVERNNSLLSSANRILNNEFSFLGLITKPLKEIDWQTDLKSGHTWPNDFYLDLREKLTKDYNKGWDIKYVWELSRFHYLIPLALAYYQTGEEKYLIKWQELILDWIKNNPVYYGPNWINAMEVAIRACNWILSFEIIKKKINELPARFALRSKAGGQILYEYTNKKFIEKFLSSLFEHGRFIFNNLEYAPLRSNHYLTDVVGLIYLGLFFQNNKEGPKWLDYGTKALEEEMKYQVYEDGVDYELSISYHRYVAELFLWTGWLCKINEQQFNNLTIKQLSPQFWLKLSKMMNFVLAIIKPNGLAPQIGDSDDSRLYLVWENYFSWEKRDYFALLRLYDYVFSNKLRDPSSARGGLRMTEDEKNPSASPAMTQQSKSFSEAGFYIMRDKDFYLITGRHQACYGKGGSHIHNDILSFELSMLGEDLIIDSGTYVYTSDYKERNKFRNTQAHNTVIIDNQEQNPLSLDPFYFEQRAQMTVKKWEEQKDFILFEAEHDAYQFRAKREKRFCRAERGRFLYLKQPVIYRRSFLWHKQNKSLSINDKFIGKGHHELEWNFHLAPEVKIWNKTEVKDKKELLLIISHHSFLFTSPQDLNCAIIEDEMSPSYGVKIPSKTIRFSGFLNKDSQKEFQFKIEPIH